MILIATGEQGCYSGESACFSLMWLRCDSDLVPHQTCGLSLMLVLALLSGFLGLNKGPCDHLGQVGFVTKQVSFHSPFGQ